MNKVAVIVPVHNHLNQTRACLERLVKEAADSGEMQIQLVVIDDGSTDGTGEWVKNTCPDVHLLSGNGKLWWSGAVNRGARFALHTLDADYLLLWNNDVLHAPDYFEKLQEIIAEYDQQTIVGSKIMVHETPGQVWSMGGYFSPSTGKYGMHGYYKPDGEQYRNPMAVDWLTGMGTLIPAQIPEILGYWNETHFPLYHGDSDFTYRAGQAGFKMVVDPRLILFNKVKSSGFMHASNLSELKRLIQDIRSKSNFKTLWRFYRLHAGSPLAYLPVIALYSKVIAGFFKWNLLHRLGIKRTHEA